MNLTLAVVQTCGPESCQVTLVDDGRSLTARYSAMLISRMKVSPMKIYPGQLVALDMDAAEPEIAWRWHRARVIKTSPEGVTVEDPAGRRIDAVRVPGLEISLTNGDEVWITGFGPTMEVHAKIIDNRPDPVERLKELILPRVIEQLSKISAQ